MITKSLNKIFLFLVKLQISWQLLRHEYGQQIVQKGTFQYCKKKDRNEKLFEQEINFD